MSEGYLLILDLLSTKEFLSSLVMKEIAGSYFILNDELISSENFDVRFLSKGINVYEVLRYKNNVPLFFEGHFARLMNSSRGNKLGQSINPQSLLKNVQKLLLANSSELGNIKIVIHAEKKTNCKLYIYQTPHYYPSENDYVVGVKLITLQEGRPDPNLKTWRPVFKDTVYFLKNKFKAYDILLVEKGLIREGSQSNFFAITDNKIITAPGKTVLRGITREIVFQICHKENILIEEVDFSLTDLRNAQAIFLTGTSPGILPISQLDNLCFAPSHPILKILLENYTEIFNKHFIKLQ